MRRLCLAVAAVAMLGISVQTASAHSAFKKALQEKYDFKTVSCNACHEKGKPKTERVEFGQAFAEEFKEVKFDGKGVTEKFEEVKSDRALKMAFEEEMEKAFLEVLKEVEKKESPNGTTWGDRLKAGDIEYIKLKDE